MDAEGERRTQAEDTTRARFWNVVVTVQPGEFRRACRVLETFGHVRRTDYYNVVTLAVDEPRAMVCELARRAQTDRGLIDLVARVAPADATFDFSTAEEFEAKARAIVLGCAAALAGVSFHVRIHRRGFKGRLDSQKEERVLAEALLDALEARGTEARVDFDDPDAVIDIETVGNRAGVTLWTRENLRANPFLRPD